MQAFAREMTWNWILMAIAAKKNAKKWAKMEANLQEGKERMKKKSSAAAPTAITENWFVLILCNE